MPDILVGATIKAADRPAAMYTLDATQQDNVTSTIPVTGSPVVDLTFTTPTTGRVLVFVGAAVRDDSGAGDAGIVGYELYEGAGVTLVQGFDTARAFIGINSSLDFHHGTRMMLVTGLTPEATHYVRLMHETTGGAGVDIGLRNLGVVPTS